MATSPILTFSNKTLQPFMSPSDARTANGQFGASRFFPSGCVIGRNTSDSKLYPCVTANNVQNATPSAAATGGTFTISLIKVDGSIGTTTALAYNASIATIQTALDTASGVTNGVVASSAGTVAPFSSNVALTLTFSGTGFSALPQPLVDIDQSLLTGATITMSYVQPNVVQTVTPTTAASAGHFTIGILRPTGVIGWTGPIAYNASIATIQTALDLASGVANGVVAGGAGAPFSSPNAMTMTYSGTGFAGLPQPLAQVILGGDIVGTTKVTVDDTTVTEDGTEVAVGFAQSPFRTDANGNCFLTTGTAAADAVVAPIATMPYYIAGTFQTVDLPGFRQKHLTDLGGRTLASGIIRIP